ncbi:MAG: 23S rRNA (guanosine(2251)-2'-O)-methyltransferase RlmB [Lachnospiraceae bacterium]|nr:23S rRNA (guanosine(2251)-2'-O)-methyltransferase RlmB [Lachnospiraceae bacterium]
MQENLNDENTYRIEGRHSVLEAFRAEKLIERLYVQKGSHDGPVLSILKEAKKNGTMVDFVPKERLDKMSETGRHQGVIANLSAFRYSTIEDMFALAKEKDEAPFFFLLDGIEDPHNLGAIIRTANLAGAHGVIIPKRRSVGLTATVVKASAGAIHYTPVARVTNLVAVMENLKDDGMWFACADMEGELMYQLNLTGSIGLVIGNEGHGISRLVREHCDYAASIPMSGNIDSLNASVAAGVLAYEIVRQRSFL